MDTEVATPVRTLSYEVTRADVLAWAMFGHELTWWEKFRLLLLISAAGLIAGMVPRDIDPFLWWTLVASILGAAGIASTVWANLELRRKAARLPIPPGSFTLDRREHSLEQHSAAGTRTIDYDRIRSVVSTDRHVFILEGTVPVIVPLSAFDSFESMCDFADETDELARRTRAADTRPQNR